MGLGDHLIADHIEHGAAGKRQGKGQDRRGNAHREEAQQSTQNFHHAGGCGNQKGTALGHTRRQHRRYQHHALGDVLQGNATRYRQRFRGISRAETDTGGDTLRQIMDGNGRNKQQDLVQLSRGFRMGLLVGSA